MKKYYIAILVTFALTVYLGKMLYDDYYRGLAFYDRPDTIITRFMEGMIWDFDDYRDRYIQNWMEDNIRDAPRYQCELIIRTAGAKDPKEHFWISVSATEKLVKIENMQNGQITYFHVSADEVIYYYPEGETYAVKTFTGVDTADAISALFFPSDLRFLGKSTYNPNDTRSIGGRLLYIAPRRIDIMTFYAPFKAISDAPLLGNKDYNAEFNVHTNFEDGNDYALKITFTDDVSDFLTYAYEALNGKGTYKFSDSYYVQTMKIIFYDDMHDFEDITIPNIQ